MLVLKLAEYGFAKLTLPDGRQCEIRIVAVDRGDVRLGLDFPRDVTIERDRVWLDRVKREAVRPTGVAADGEGES